MYERRKKRDEERDQTSTWLRRGSAVAPLVGTAGGALVGGTLGAIGGGIAGGGPFSVPGAITGGLAGAGAGAGLGGAAGTAGGAAMGYMADEMDAKRDEEEIKKARRLEQALMMYGPYMNRG